MVLMAVEDLLESLGSARLEGNRTAIAEIIEENINPVRADSNEQHQEVRNVESALQYIDDYIKAGQPINESFVREIHKRIVKGLTPPSQQNPDAEGDPTPGRYRQGPVVITNSPLRPPRSRALVASNMASLMEFIQQDVEPKYDLIKAAIAHHRFTAIHPFNNGNGRTVRALTYAMLLQQDFSVADVGRILNPTAIFCNDRAEYVSRLSHADSGSNEALVEWSTYVISGLKDEIEKIDRLSDFSYVRDNLILPAIKDALERQSISQLQRVSKIHLSLEISQGLSPIYSSLKRSRLLKKMVDQKLLKPVEANSRRYVISFSNSYLLRGAIMQLQELGFIPPSLSQ